MNAAARGPRKAAASGAPQPAPLSAKVRGLGVAVVCLTSLAQLARALVRVDDRSLWPWYLGLGAAYMALFAFTVMRPPGRRWQAHALLAGQCLIVLSLLSLEHHQDFMTGLFVPIALEAALLFAGRETWTWVAVLAALIVGSLMFYLEPLEGLSQALASLALEIVLAAYVVVAREIESARRRSQVMLEELQAAHDRLQGTPHRPASWPPWLSATVWPATSTSRSRRRSPAFLRRRGRREPSLRAPRTAPARRLGRTTPLARSLPLHCSRRSKRTPRRRCPRCAASSPSCARKARSLSAGAARGRERHIAQGTATILSAGGAL